jgi:ribosomal protein L7/L12
VPVHMSKNSQLVFFNTLFGEGSPTSKRVSQLIESGFKVESDLYFVKLIKGQDVFSCLLSAGVSALMKKQVPPAIQNAEAVKIEKFVTSVWDTEFKKEGSTYISPTQQPPQEEKVPLVAWYSGFDYPVVNVIKILRQFLLLDLKVAKDLSDSIKGSSYQHPYNLGHFNKSEAIKLQKALVDVGISTKMLLPIDALQAPAPYEHINLASQDKEVPTKDVIPLRFAKAVGQPVKGTSAGSVYHTIAIGERVRVAARVFKNGSISIRVEWETITNSEKAKLQANGFSINNDYASIHLSAGEVPYSRIIGGFLLGMELPFKDQITDYKQIVLQEKE